ncbi:hypothetical protein NIES4102_01140 [Chondrocystis sp. NIES-4102]|nr:hypothetical protein NIES4102_01140 [Chondrocystis sp. NIES-4102]
MTIKSKTKYNYLAYGLKIESAIELPELIESQATNFDVSIEFADLLNSPLKDLDKYFFCCDATAEGLYAYWSGLGTLFISQGNKIVIDPVTGFDERRLRLFILGAAMGAILHQRGYIVLHGSAVAINQRAVVFVADKGRGKSTMAADLEARGYNLLADDVVAIGFEEEFIVYPAFPQLKLWTDAVTQTGKDPHKLPKLIEQFEKREYINKDKFSQTPLQLQQIFILDYNSHIAIKSLSAQEILLNLLRHSYVARFGSSLLKPSDAAHLLKITKLANLIPINLLLRPKNLELLSQVSQTVEQYLKSK